MKHKMAKQNTKPSPDKIRKKVISTGLQPIQDQINRLLSSLSTKDRIPGRETQKYKDAMRKIAKLQKNKTKIEVALAKKLISLK